MATQQSTSAVFTNLVREAESFAQKTGSGIEPLAGEIVKLKILRDNRVRQIPVTAVRVEDYLG